MTNITLRVLDKYDLPLLPGEATPIPGQKDLSYYEYVSTDPNSSRWNETAKNLLCVLHCLEGVPKGISLEEPFGGVGVFTVVLRGELKPVTHRLFEIDPQCYKQLTTITRGKKGMQVKKRDANKRMGRKYSDVFVIDFPFFTLVKWHKKGIWKEGFQRVFKQKPKRILVTDGASALYQTHWFKTGGYAKSIGITTEITKERESYVKAMSELYWKEQGYSITRCGYHGSCFYYALEPKEPSEIDFKFFPSGSGKGLIKIASNTEEI